MPDDMSLNDRINQLRDVVAAAYDRARTEVFDHEGPGADPSDRTERQKRLVSELADREHELQELRKIRHDSGPA